MRDVKDLAEENAMACDKKACVHDFAAQILDLSHFIMTTFDVVRVKYLRR